VGDHEQRAAARQRRDDIGGNTVGEAFLVRIVADAGEGEYRDGGFVQTAPGRTPARRGMLPEAHLHGEEIASSPDCPDNAL
jgi:hypothetical protein